jgi:hypothetical protein
MKKLVFNSSILQKDFNTTGRVQIVELLSTNTFLKFLQHVEVICTWNRSPEGLTLLAQHTQVLSSKHYQKSIQGYY